ncbi:Heme d1 biosynthesis protein NirD / Heme d1 biosynthesis protein NirL [hydrothermal vent metagenome]|uniref:siroheme decarboxylase n=1 Tax=hydrothermal vent metagenome TaxID=652676 RepID=A0A3B1AI61_9ZZZZ
MHRVNTTTEVNGHLNAHQHGQRKLSELERHLLNDFQHNLPFVSRPFKKIAKQLGSSEAIVIDTLNKLKQRGFISRVGAVFRANSIGASTLAAMVVPTNELECIAAMVSSYSEVNHNYQREHHFNLWFVVTASDEEMLNSVLYDIEQRSGFPVMSLPMLEDYHIDLGFDLGMDFERGQETEV